jgi:hypothetical protein
VAKALSNQCPENVSTMFKISNSDKYNLRSNITPTQQIS